MTTAPADPLALVVVNNGLDVSENAPIIQPFIEFMALAEVWRDRVATIKVSDVSDIAGMKVARESRLALKGIRVDANKARIRLKEESLKRGKMIDGLYAVIDGLVSPLEANLLEQEEFAERSETARKSKLKTDRETLLKPFGADTSFYALGDMDDATFKDLFDGLKTAAENKAEQQRAAEAVRVAQEAAERERQNALRIENDRLKKEQAEKDAAARKERDAQQAIIDKERAEARERDRLATIEVDKANREAARIRAERTAEIQKMHDQRAREQEAARKAALAPDREKLLAVAAAIRTFQVPEMLSADGISAQIDILERVEELANYVESLAKKF